MRQKIFSVGLTLLATLPAMAQIETDSATLHPQNEEQIYDTLNLESVTVTSMKKLVKMEADKMTYDVQGDADARSATVLDLLRKVPMVTVDGQDNITVNGSRSFQVHVDGKPNLMITQNASQVFKMMPASSVQKIEVITNPGARYDAEGTAGVLNLVMNKAAMGGSTDGVSATLRGSAGNRTSGGGANLIVQEGKLSVSANALYNYQNTKGMVIEQNRTTMSDGSTMQLRQDSKQTVPFHMGNINMTYDIDSLNTISGSVGYNGYNAHLSGNQSITLSNNGYSQPFTNEYESSTRLKTRAVNVSADWQHFVHGNRNHTFTLSYLFSHLPTTTTIDQEYNQAGMPDLHSHNRTKSMEHTWQADYSRPVGEGQTLNMGAKYILRRNTSKAVDATSALNALDYTHTNDIAALYAEYGISRGIFSGKGGLRYEQTWQDVEYAQGQGRDFSKHYGNLVPSVSLSLSPGGNQNIGLTYNMRISRPGITYLNPYVQFSSPTEESHGDTGIEVEKTHNTALTYSYYSPKLMLNTSLRQSFANDQIDSYSYYSDGILHTTYGNIVKARNTTLTTYLNWAASSTTRIILNANGGYVDIRSNELAERNHGWQTDWTIGAQQTLPWQLRLSLNYFGSSRSYDLQGWNSGFNAVMGSITKTLLSDRLNISLVGVSGIEKGGNIYFDTYSCGREFKQKQHIKYPIQQWQISVSYTLGNKRVQGKQHTSRIENDFKEKKSDQEQIGSTTGM